MREDFLCRETSKCKGWRWYRCGMFWDSGWFCEAGVMGEGERDCKFWGHLDPGDGNGDKNVPTCLVWPELSVGQRTGAFVTAVSRKWTCLSSEDSDLQDPGSNS